MDQAGTTRFTVSLPDALMETLRRLQRQRRYENRSEFVRDLLRAELVKEEWRASRGEMVGVLTLVYDHDRPGLADRLAEIQHRSFRMIASAQHIHLDPHTCLEVVVLRGGSARIRDLAGRMLAMRGVRYGQLVPAPSGQPNAGGAHHHPHSPPAPSGGGSPPPRARSSRAGFGVPASPGPPPGPRGPVRAPGRKPASR